MSYLQLVKIQMKATNLSLVRNKIELTAVKGKSMTIWVSSF